ncbi:hypothetical protein RHGRI_000564 [Rhododendron griersonianum]|uniref:Phytocyanin domain-containing protein n=1 Tax=Rhododendron griersonianum TaxID=479676 RepID=A0AAV6LI94_9ERIC|nr:hypothetical protein RHGRI_000564 [Rhododendron griersonianum]
MAGKTTLATLVLAVVAAAALMEGAAATVYFVGDATAWIIPPSAAFYSTWAANHTFAVGDILGKNLGCPVSFPIEIFFEMLLLK